MKHILLIFIALCLMPKMSHAQGEFIPGTYKIKNYTAKIYQGDFQTWNIVQNKNGILYFANNTSILEFDGSKWHSINIGSKVLSLAIDTSGVIYVGGVG